MRRPCTFLIRAVMAVGVFANPVAGAAAPVSKGVFQLPPPWLHWAERDQGAAHPQSPFPAAPSIQALLVVGPDTVFAGSFGMGIFRSEDRGRTWTAANVGLTDQFVLSFATEPDGTLYVGTVRAGVFRSRDGGKSWHAINEGLKRLQIKALLVSQGLVYAGTGDGVYRYSKRKNHWQVMTDGLKDVLVHSLAMASDGTLYAGTSGKGVMQHKARVRGWTRTSRGLSDHEGLNENFIRVLAVDSEQAIYAGTFDGGVFRSVNKGETWKPISRALPNDSIRGIVTASDSRLYVGTGRGVFKTLTHGREWISINKGLTELSIQSLVRSSGGSLYAGTSGGAFRSDDDGQSWVAINEGLQGSVSPPFNMFK